MPEKIVEIEGLQELLQQLSKIANIDPKEVQDVLLGGAKIFRDEVQANAPVGETGNLKKSFKAKRGDRSRYYAMAFVANDRKIAPHTHLVEEGHQQVKGGKLSKGGRVVGKVKAHPFFWPAIRAKEAEVENFILNGLDNLVLKDLEKQKGAVK